MALDIFYNMTCKDSLIFIKKMTIINLIDIVLLELNFLNFPVIKYTVTINFVPKSLWSSLIR